MYIKADRILSGITGGAINSAQLQTLLADPGYLGAFRSGILYSPPRRDVLLASSQAAAVIAGSALAASELTATPAVLQMVIAESSWLGALVKAPVGAGVLYMDTAFIAALFGSQSKAVFAPHANQITLSGSEVAKWRNCVTGATHLYGGSAGARPTFNGQAAGGFTTLAFDGANDILQGGPAGLFSSSESTFYLVIRPTTMTGPRAWIGSSAANSGYFGSSGSTGQIFLESTGGYFDFPSQAEPVANTWQMFRLRKVATGVWYAKRNAEPEVALGSAVMASVGSLGVGYRPGGGLVPERFFAGQMAEIVNLGKSAGDADADNIRITELLRSKYALW